MKVGSPKHMVSVGWHPSVSWEERRVSVRAFLESGLGTKESRERLEAELAELDKGEDALWPLGRSEPAENK
jgi:hypothetical protein